MKITTAGTVISGKDIRAGLMISAANVTVQNSLIHGYTPEIGSGTAILEIRGSGARILNNDIQGDSATDTKVSPSNGIKVYASAELAGNDIKWIADDPVTFTDDGPINFHDNWIHDQTQRANVHFDGISYDYPAGAAKATVTIRHNTVDLWVPGQMSNTLRMPYNNPNLTIDDNLLAGGGYTIGGGGSGTKIINNRFDTVHAPKCGVYSSHYYQNAGVVWTNNAYYTNDKIMAVVPL